MENIEKVEIEDVDEDVDENGIDILILIAFWASIPLPLFFDLIFGPIPSTSLLISLVNRALEFSKSWSWHWHIVEGERETKEKAISGSRSGEIHWLSVWLLLGYPLDPSLSGGNDKVICLLWLGVSTQLHLPLDSCLWLFGDFLIINFYSELNLLGWDSDIVVSLMNDYMRIYEIDIMFVVLSTFTFLGLHSSYLEICFNGGFITEPQTIKTQDSYISWLSTASG